MAVEYVCRESLKISVLTWDRYDSRHSIVGRDDIENTLRMYYKGFVDMARRWGVSKWNLFPDEDDSLNWQSLLDVLGNSKISRPRRGQLQLFEKSERRFQIYQLVTQDSEAEPCIQLADLFAGMGHFSIEKTVKLKEWLGNSSQNPKQFGVHP